MRFLWTLSVLSFFNLVHAQEQVGDSLMAVGRYDQALIAYKNTEETAERQFKMARAATSMGNLAQALDFYRSGFETDSVSVRPRWEFGKLILGTNNYVEALSVFKELTLVEPDNAAYHYYLGKTFAIIDQDEEAIKSFETALQLVPDYRSARVELVKSYIAKRESLKAIALCRMHLLENPDDIKMNSLYAQSLMNAKNFSTAVTVLEHLFELGNDTEYNRKTLAFAYYNIAAYEQSLQQYELFLKDYNDKDPAAHFVMSKCYLSLGRLDEAQDYIERAIVFKTPVLDQEYLQLASVYANKKDLKNTYYALKKASKENPNSQDIAYQVVLGADRYFKDKKEKLRHYENFMEQFPGSDYYEMASARASDLKKEIFMEGE
jgi:tetratricopeptide (TPR) repeat protein